jgi:3,4-dihydroxy 2-butanone 4-phosphate synthase/GTP cyclohydrolase II
MTPHDAPTVSDALAAGRPVLLIDDLGSDPTGSLVFAAQFASADSVAFAVRYTSGFLSAARPAARADALELPALVSFSDMTTVAGVSCDAVHGISTGISAHDRACTLRVLADPASRQRDLSRPGHIVPLRTKAASVVERPDIANAALELLRSASCGPVAAICELVSTTTPVELADRDETFAFAAEHELCVTTVSEVVRHAMRSRSLVRRGGVAHHEVLDTGTRIAVIEYTPLAPGRACSAVVVGNPFGSSPVLVNVVVEHFRTGLARTLTGRGPSLTDRALDEVTAAGGGVVVYFGSVPIDAAAQDGLGERDLAVAAAVLRDLGVDVVRAGAHNEIDSAGLTAFGVQVAGVVPNAEAGVS